MEELILNDKLKTRLLLMHQGDHYDNKENLSEETLLSYGFMWFEREKSWIKIFR